MNASIIGTLLRKDLMLYFRNPFFAYITIAGLIAYIAIYLVMPATVDEDLSLAMYAPGIPDVLLNQLSDNEIGVTPFESEEALQQAITEGEYVAGLVMEPETMTAILLGREAEVQVYLASDTPTEAVDAVRSVLRLTFNQMSYTLSGNPLNITFAEEVLGIDMAGQQIPARDRLLPLIAVFVLVMEMLGLGSLVAEELETGTMRAVLITPASVSGVFIAKGAMGVLLGFTQAVLIMGITGNLDQEPVIILLTLLIGAMLVTGIGFLIASVSRDMMGVMSWGILVILALLIPAYGVVFPGTITDWVKVIPSYYMLDTIHRVVNFDLSWGAVWTNLVVLSVMAVAFMAAGVMVVERRMR